MPASPYVFVSVYAIPIPVLQSTDTLFVLSLALDFTSRPAAVEMWPIEERLTRTLGISSGLANKRGQISLRWALKSDVKVTNARNQSKYYEKYGAPPVTEEGGRKKRRRGDDDEDEDGGGGTGGEDGDGGSLRRRIDMGDGRKRARDREQERAELDAELERFANGDTDPAPAVSSAPARSPSELDSTSIPLSERLGPSRDGRRIAPLPGRRKGGGGGGGAVGERERRDVRPAPNKDALDAELEAFLNSK